MSWQDYFGTPDDSPPPPTESVGQPDAGGGSGGGWERYFEAKPNDGTESVGQAAPPVQDAVMGTDDASQKRKYSPMDYISDPTYTPPADISTPAPTESVGQPQAPSHPTEDVGKKDDGGFWGFVRDIPDEVTRAIPFTNMVREGISDIPDVIRGDMNPLDAARRSALATGAAIKGLPGSAMDALGYATDTSNRIMGVAATDWNQLGQNLRSGDIGAAVKDLATSPVTVGAKNAGYILSGDQANLTPTEYGTNEVLSKNWLGSVLPTEGGSGQGPRIGPVDLYDVPVVGGVARTGAALAGVPSALDEGPSIDVNALRNDLQSGMSIPDAMKKYGGNEGTTIASQFLSPISFAEVPGTSEFLNGIHAVGMGTTDSAASRIMRELFSPGSLASVDKRAADQVAARFSGSAAPDVIAQALVDHANAPEYGVGSALRDLVTGQRPGIADQDRRVLDHAINTFQRGFADPSNARFATLEDYITHQLTPDAGQIVQQMVDRNITNPLEQYRSMPSFEGNWARGVISKAAQDSMDLTGVQNASAGLLNRFGQYLQTGEFRPQSAIGRGVNDLRQTVASDVKTGLLAFSPRYYLQNIIDNVWHALLDGGYSPFQNTFTSGQERAVSGLRGVRGTGHVPDFFNNEYGVAVDTGQTLARTAREEAAQRAQAQAGQRAGLTDVLGIPSKVGGKLLETLGDPAENLPRQSLWSRLFFDKIDPQYQALANDIRNDVLTHPSPDIQAIGQRLIDGLQSGDATSFQKATKILADATTSDPYGQPMLDYMRRELPNRIDSINKLAANDAYLGVQRVFNNYDLHVKYLDTLANSIFLFNKYQTRQPLYLAGQMLQHPGFFQAQANANQAMRDWNAQNRPDTRGSTQERLWFGKFGVNPLDTFPWDKMYNALTGKASQTDQDTFGLRQDRLSQLARGLMNAVGTIGLSTPALPAQWLGERARVLPPSLSNVTDQPFIHALKSVMPDWSVPKMTIPGVTVAGQPVTVGGGTVSTGGVLGNVLSPQAFIEHAINTLTGRQTNTSLMDYYTGVMLTDMYKSTPGANLKDYKAQWDAKSGPLYDEAVRQAVAYQQQSRDFNSMFPGGTSVELPRERQVGLAKAATDQAYGAASANVDRLGKIYTDALKSGDPDQIAAAEAQLSGAAGQLTGARGQDAKISLFHTPFSPTGDNAEPSPLTQLFANQKATRDNYYANPYTPENAALADRQRAAAQKYGESTLFGSYIPDNATPDQIAQAKKEQAANITRNSIDQGTFLNPADRQKWLDYKANEKRLGDVIAGKDASGKDLKVSDMVDPLKREKARALAIGDTAAADAAQGKIDALRKSNGAVDTYYKGTDASFVANDMRRLNALQDAAIGSPSVQASLAPLRVARDSTLGGVTTHFDPLQGYTPRSTQSALTDRWLYTQADPAVQRAMIDRQNLTDRYWSDNASARAKYDEYNKINDLNAKDAFLKANPDLQRTLGDLRAIDARITKDDRIAPALAQLREQEFMRANPAWGFDQNRLWDQGRLQRDQTLYETMNDAQRAAYAAYGDFNNTATAQRYFELRDQLPQKGAANYSSWWHDNGSTYYAARDAYNAGIDNIQRQTGADPRAVSNQLRQAQGLPVSEYTPSPAQRAPGSTGGGTGGGGGTTRSSGYSSGGGSTRRSSSGGGGSSATALAIAGRDSFYNVFDNLSSREKAALHDVVNSYRTADSRTNAGAITVDYSALDKVLTKGSRPTAEEWNAGLKAMNDALPTIRETQGLRDNYYAMMDTLTSREKSQIRDLTSRVADLKANADTIRAALASARDRLANPTSDTYTSGFRTSSGGGSGLHTAADILKYGGYGAPGIAESGSTASNYRPTTSSSQNRYASDVARTTYTIRTTSTPRTTTKKKVA